MTERKEFTPYGYNPYQHQAGAQPSMAAQEQRIEMQRRNRGLIDKVFGEEIAGKMRTPLFATLSLLAIGVAFAAVVAISYPSGSDGAGGNVPVITAQAESFKIKPGEEGAISVAHQDSTVFNVVSSADTMRRPFDNNRPIENLLEPDQDVEEAVDTLQAFAEEAKAAAQLIEPASGDDDVSTPKKPVESLLVVPEAKIEAASADDILKKIYPDTPDNKSATITQTREKVAPQDLVRNMDATPKQPEKLHAAGASPDTIAFVRNVLEKTDGKKTSGVSAKVSQKQAANLAAVVEPASGGDAIKAPSVMPGHYYVQLGSVTSRDGASNEWTKMQKSMPLNGLEHRVQEANLGDRGMFYRIQAGPMSKDSASALCDSIKAQKPGGCLVVK